MPYFPYVYTLNPSSRAHGRLPRALRQVFFLGLMYGVNLSLASMLHTSLARYAEPRQKSATLGPVRGPSRPSMSPFP